MRLILGIILGILLTIGAAYYHDANVRAATPGGQTTPEPAAGQIVNWEVLGALAREEMTFLQDFWNRATGKTKPV